MPLTQQQYTKLKDLLEVARQLQSEDRVKDNTDYVDALLRQTTDPAKREKLERLKNIFDYNGGRYRESAAGLIRDLDSLMTYKNDPQFQDEHVQMMNRLKDYFSLFEGYYDTLNEVLENADGYDVLHDKHSTFTRHVVPSVTRLSNLYGEFLPIYETVPIQNMEATINDLKQTEAEYYTLANEVYQKYGDQMDTLPGRDRINQVNEMFSRSQQKVQELAGQKDAYKALYDRYKKDLDNVKKKEDENKRQYQDAKTKRDECAARIEMVKKNKARYQELEKELDILHKRYEHKKKEYENVRDALNKKKEAANETDQYLTNLSKKHSTASQSQHTNEGKYKERAKTYYMLKKEAFYWKKTLDLAKEMKEFTNKNGYVSMVLFPDYGAKRKMNPIETQNMKEAYEQGKELLNKIKKTYPGKHGAKYTKTDENAKNYIKVVDRLIEKAQRRYDESMANLEKDTTYKAGVRHNDLQNALNSKIDIFNQSGKLDEKTAAEKEIDKLNKDLVELETERYNKSIPDANMIDSWIEQKYDQDQVKLDKEEMEVDKAYMDTCMVADDINLKKKEMEDLKRDTYLKCNRAFIEINEKYEKDEIKDDEYKQIQDQIRNSQDALDCDFDRLMDDPAKNMNELDVKIKGCEATAKQLKEDRKAAKQGMEKNSEEAYNNAVAEANRALESNRKVKTEMEQKIKDLNDLHTLHNSYATKTEKAIAQYDTFKKDRKQLTATNISSMCGKYLRDYGKSRSWIHKLSSDSDEYKAIKTQLEKLQDPEAVKAMSSAQINRTLTDLQTACDTYLAAKRAQDEETFRIEALSTNQRTYRIFFAKTVMEYCTNQLNANKDVKVNLGAGADGYMQRHQENPAKVTNNMDALLKQIKKAGSDKKLPKPDPEIKVDDKMKLRHLAIKAPM